MKKLELNDLMTEIEHKTPATPTRIGKLMIWAAWLLALGLLTLYFQGYLNKRENPNQVPNTKQMNGINELILQQNHQHHYLTSGTINEINVTFLVDTGATQVSVPAHLARKLRLSSGISQISNTANGLVETHSTVINSLSMGSIQLHNVRANINPGMLGDEILLGMSALKDIEFTHKNGVLTLKQY
jgi:aspartyl protease family protein